MASHHLAIAKASFSAGLLRPDPTSVPRDEITNFHTAFDRALSHCSPANIQTCKSWLLNYVVLSSNRVGVWAKYLVALSNSFGDEGKPEATRPVVSAKRKRLHILYLLNDVFHHTKFHLDSTAAFSTLSGSLQPFIVELLSYAASYPRDKHPKHHKRLDDLLDIWAEHGYYGSDYVDKLREVVRNSAESGPMTTSIDIEASNLAASKHSGKDMPFMMPSTHGDPSMPYYDLPAGNLVPHIIPNSTVSLRPDSIKPIQLLAGPADQKLVTALKDFLKDVDRMYGTSKPDKEDNEVIDIDELGETVIRDSETGEIIDGDTYYGWSRAFCQQMKNRNAKSGSRSRSRSPRKRRYSDSLRSDDSNWSRSRSRSRTPSRKKGLNRFDSRSRSRSRSAPRRSRSRERSYSPPRAPEGPRHFPPEHHQRPYQPHPPHNQYGNNHTQGYPPPPPPMHFPPGPQTNPPPPYPPGMPGAPPPPPPNYQGAWPPPPPPPMPHYGSTPGGNFPPPYPPSQFPPVHIGQGQQMPPGSYHFPPPHSGGRGGGNWGQQPGYPPGRWR